MNPLSTWIQSNQLTTWSAIQSDPRFTFLKSAASNIAELVQIVEAMGWQSVSEAVEALKPFNAMAPFIAETRALSFDRDDLVTVKSSQLRNDFALDTGLLLPAKVKGGIQTDIAFTDETYGLLTKSQIFELAAKTPTADLQYIPEVMDCDDFTFAMKGWLVEQGLGNASIGPGFIQFYKDDARISGHAALIAIDDTHNAWWVEPQSGKVYDIQEIYITGLADRAVITDWLL